MAIYEPEHLSPRAKTVVADRSNELFVSLATIWEMGNKIAAGRVPAAGTFLEQLVKRAEDLGSTLLPIHLAEIVASSNLPRHHADPFDRLLIAQAQIHDLHLVTYDKEIAKYDVPTIW